MAVVHRTTLAPTKLELLAAWLPKQPWYCGIATPELARAGGFRLDDPAGEVGIEFMVVTDTAGQEVTSYLVPMTYRGSALQDADAGLIGTAEHGVLGHRFVYDGPHDPVFRTQLTALIRGTAQPQMQSQSNAPDPTVFVGATAGAASVDLVRVLAASDAVPAAGEVLVPWRLPEAREVSGIIARAS
jgi:hypothetical protein